MSYDRPYRGRRRYRDDYEDRRREIIESPQEKVKNAILKLGEVDAMEELPRLEQQIRDLTPVPISDISETLHFAVTEQPYKIPFYAALILQLSRVSGDSENGDPINIGQQILEDFWKGFQTYLDKLAWRQARFCVHFFAHSTVAGLITHESMIFLLQSFAAVLEEFGVSMGRGKHAALCVAEGIMISGIALVEQYATAIQSMISILETYNETTAREKWLVNPTTRLYSSLPSNDNVDELLDTLLASLNSLTSDNFSTPGCFMRPYTSIELNLDHLPIFTLPSVLVPPEVIELDALPNDAENDVQILKEEWPLYSIRVFDDDITPNPNSPTGYAVRAGILSIIDIYEVNRKECARILLEYPKWTTPDTFKPKPGSSIEPVSEAVVDANGRQWQLESTILEITLSLLFLLPHSLHKPIYYISLMTELCKLSPTTVGPAVGKSIRKLYSSLSDGLDVEIGHRFAEWFAIHMSNFGFQWVWKEWVPDLALSIYHPKRSFMRHALELEIRLSYYERISKTLPEQMTTIGAQVLPEQAPTPAFEYENPDHPHHDAAQSVMNLLRGRASVEDVIKHLDILKNSIENADSGHIDVDSVVRSIALQSLLNIGSRSFSHLLNAIERYLPLLRTIASGDMTTPGSPATAVTKAEILSIVATFWKFNSQMVGIVADKLMQYQIVDPTDVISWVFASSQGLKSSDTYITFDWEILKAAIDKANGRVVIAKRKVAALRKEDDDNRARTKAIGEDMDVDTEINLEEGNIENAALTSALKAFSSLKKEQKLALSATLEGFVTRLLPSSEDSSSGVISEESWQNRELWQRAEWETWITWCWYIHFCRTYSSLLRGYSTTLSVVFFSKLEGSKDASSILLKRIFSLATREEY